MPVEDCYQFWKLEVKVRLVEPDKDGGVFRLEDFPGEYCFIASEWRDGAEASVILLEKYH